MEIDLEQEGEPAAVVLDFAAFKARREKERASGWSFFVSSDGRLELTTPAGLYVFHPGSAEQIGRYLVRAAAHYRNKAAREETQRVHLPAIRAAMNDAILAARAGGRDEPAEAKVERLRHTGWTWQMLEKRERDRWLRHMRKRRQG